VGTGPYVLKSFTPQHFLLVANPGYWQRGLPKIYGLEVIAVTAQSEANLTEADQLDWSSGGAPGAQAWVKKSPYNHYWFPGAGTVSIEPNLTKWPLNQVAVRKAISLALNRAVIGSKGEFGYEYPVTSATGLLSSQSSFVVPQYRKNLLRYAPAQAKKTLEQAGWKMGHGGIFVDSAGKQLAFTISDPSGFVDYMTDCQLMREELKAAGMALTCEGISTNAWTSDVASGEFDATIRWSDFGNGNPFFVYNGWLNDKLTAPIGRAASDDFERYRSPSAQSALQAYASASTPVARAAALSTLEGILVTDMPVIPLFDSADWGTYITKHAVGWATPQDPYSDDAPGGSYAELVALHLRPVR
jgi:peptide/nickel transport system substrate-binding protein